MFMCNTLEDKVFVWADGHFSIVSKVTFIQVARRFFFTSKYLNDIFLMGHMIHLHSLCDLLLDHRLPFGHTWHRIILNVLLNYSNIMC